MNTLPPLGAHLVTARVGYTHHGIHIGDGRVIHYSGLANGLQSGPVEETDLTTFTAGNGFQVRTYLNAFPAPEIVKRAKSRVGENGYSVFNNNCEHFCLWCTIGEHASPQVDTATWVSAPSAGTIVGLGARAVVAASGSVVGLSGAGIMSGLASTGAVVGGGAVAGVAVLGGAPAIAMASLVNNTVLADNPVLDDKERESRTIGRVASYTGAAVGTAGSVAAISAMGTAGLSAVGITSGLAAIGTTVGGGMAAGVVVATTAPLAATVAVGYGVYKIAQWLKS